MPQRASGRQEEQEARVFSALLDGRDEAGSDPELAALMQVAGQLAQLPGLLPPPDRAWAEATWRKLSSSKSQVSGWKLPDFPWMPAQRWLRPVAVAGGLAAVLFAAVLFTVPGQRAVGVVSALFHLPGNSVVRVAPDIQLGNENQVTQTLSGVDEATKLVPYRLRQIQSLPAGYSLHHIEAVSFKGLPEWVHQPFYIEMDYRPATARESYVLTLRQFTLDARAQISDFLINSNDVSDTGHTQVAGQPAVYVVYHISDVYVNELIWQQNDVLLKLFSQTLNLDQMREIAASVE